VGFGGLKFRMVLYLPEAGILEDRAGSKHGLGPNHSYVIMSWASEKKKKEQVGS
jgi:hypothetical protein